MGKCKGDTTSVITTIFSVLFVAVIIVMIAYVAMPWMQSFFIDQCWANFASQTGNLAAGMYMFGYKNVTLDFGECASSLVFTNDIKQLKPITDELQKQILRETDGERDIPITDMIFGKCNDEEKAFIVAVPDFGKKGELGSPWLWMIGGFVAGSYGGLKVPLLGNAKIKSIPLLPAVGGITGIMTADDLRAMLSDHFAAMEEKAKSGVCFSLGMPFEEDFKIFPLDDEIKIESGDSGEIKDVKFEPYEGKYCILLFKGKENYYARGKIGTCKQNENWVKGEIESNKTSETGKGN